MTIAWRPLAAAITASLCFPAQPAFAQSVSDDSNANLAKELSNPVASLISVPFQTNFDQGLGPGDHGKIAYTNIQPVIPFSLNDDWNVVSRTIVPVAWSEDIAPGGGERFGLKDTLQSFFLTPKAPGPDGFIWGLGPAILIPTATDPFLGGEKWATGPTGVILKQTGPWTVGVLSNQLWSFAGSTQRSNVSSTFIQPFISYTTPDAWTFTLQSESTYDWIGRSWSIPVNFVVTKLLTFGTQTVSVGGGLRYWVTSPDGGPKGVGGRLVLTFLFPAK